MSPEHVFKLIDNARKELDDLEAAFRYASSVQFQRSPGQTASPGEVRGRGGHADPTGDIVVDPKRLSVRSTVKQAERDVERIYMALKSTTGSLRHSTRRWEGPV